MGAIVLRTEDTWNTQTIPWSGGIPSSGVKLFTDPYLLYITGRHRTMTGGILTVTRIAGISGGNGGISCGPKTFVACGKMSHYLSEFGEAIGSIYIECRQDTAGEVYSCYSYPEEASAWTTLTPCGRTVDILGIDFPDSPRVLIATSETISGVIIMNTGSGLGAYTASSLIDMPSGLIVTDLETYRIL